MLPIRILSVGKYIHRLTYTTLTKYIDELEVFV